MQFDVGERTDLCFGELLDEARHENPLWVVPTFHGVHTLHAKICYALSCDMDAMEKIFTGTNSSHPRLNRYSGTNLFPRTKYHTSKSGETLPVSTRWARASQLGKDLQRGWHAQTPNWEESA